MNIHGLKLKARGIRKAIRIAEENGRRIQVKKLIEARDNVYDRIKTIRKHRLERRNKYGKQ